MKFMKICLLKCGSVISDLQKIHGDYDDMFRNFFKNNNVNITLDVYKVFDGEYPENLSKYDGFLSSGSLASVYDDDPWIKVYRQFIKDLYDKEYKHAGICFGHQMIAHALGGKVERARQGWGMGIKKTTVKKYISWMNSRYINEFNLIFSHQDQVVELPPHATIIAANEHCPVSMFTVSGHFLGIQAHPEFTREYSRASIESRRKTVDAIITEHALDSLSLTTDEKFIAIWIENFFKEK